MIFHVLNGDALAEKFPVDVLSGKVFVCREAFIEGPLSVRFDEDFWDKRRAFVKEAYDADHEDYARQFSNQLEILDQIRTGDEVNLWFEDDLFCVTNMWFVMAYTGGKNVEFYRIFPPADTKWWSGFGKSSSIDLINYFENRIRFDEGDVILSRQLWEAYAGDNREKLKALSFSETSVFRYLPEVVQAHLERFPRDGTPGRPEKKLLEIIGRGKNDFYEIFEEFVETESIYGFGDEQVKNMLITI